MGETATGFTKGNHPEVTYAKATVATNDDGDYQCQLQVSADRIP